MGSIAGCSACEERYLLVSNESGLGVDLNEEEVAKHPYSEKNFLRLFEEGWETRKPG